MILLVTIHEGDTAISGLTLDSVLKRSTCTGGSRFSVEFISAMWDSHCLKTKRH